MINFLYSVAVSKLLPQISKSFPQVSKSFPQDSKSLSQDMKSFSRVTKSCFDANVQAISLFTTPNLYRGQPPRARK